MSQKSIVYGFRMVPAAIAQGLGRIFSFVKTHGLHNGLGLMAVKVQIRWCPKLKGVSASGRCLVFQLELCMVPAVLNLELA